MKKIPLILFISLLCVNLSYAQSRKAPQKAELLSDSMTKVAPVKKGETLVVPGFHFETGSSALNGNVKKYIKNVASQIKRVKYQMIYVDGYTDNRGDNAYNNRLSRARAKAVADELIKNGINGKKIKARGYGSSRPVADNNTRNGRIQNRRIEIKIR